MCDGPGNHETTTETGTHLVLKRPKEADRLPLAADEELSTKERRGIDERPRSASMQCKLLALRSGFSTVHSGVFKSKEGNS